MRQLNRKHGVLAAVAMLAIPLAIAATAFACGSLATLKLNRATARAGDQLAASGGNYNTSPRASTVQLRFNSRNGRVLWEGRPNSNGRISAAFSVPQARAGYYMILTTQIGPDGRAVAGTPGRAPLRIKGASAAKAAAAAPAAWAALPGDGPTAQGGPVGLMPALAIAALAFGLLGGALAVVRTARRRSVHVARSVS